MNPTSIRPRHPRRKTWAARKTELRALLQAPRCLAPGCPALVADPGDVYCAACAAEREV